MLKASMIVLMTVGIWSGQALADDGFGPRWGWQQAPGPGMIQHLGAIDTNDDGMISDDEAAAQVELVFAAMDGDDDGELTEDEYMSVRMGPGRGFNQARQKVMQERKKTRFAEMDHDKNGKVSKAEFMAAGKTRFEAADTDKDGRVTPWEFRAQHRNLM